MTTLPDLPEDIVSIICCSAARLRDPNPCVEDVKTLALLSSLINEYNAHYGSDEGLDWLGNDLDEYLPEHMWNYGVHRKWMRMTPAQRRNFFIVWV